MLNEILGIGEFIWKAFLHSWPYILITIPLAVIVNISGISRYIGKAFKAQPILAILLATIVGAFSPFCSCGVIPIISALLISGVPIAPVMSFWLASPSMDPEIFFLSVSQIGLDLAVWRLTGTFILSLGAGYITHILVKIKWLEKDILKISDNSSLKRISLNPLKILKKKVIPVTAGAEINSCNKIDTIQLKQSCSCSAGSESAEKSEQLETGCNDSCKSKKEPVLYKKILKEVSKVSIMILKFMLLAFFLEALIIRYLPSGLIVDLLGKSNSLAIPTSALIGVPLYTTNLTALGLIGGLLKQGMDPAAALAFLIGGATTTIPAMAAVYGLVKPKVFILYLGFALGGSLLFGYLFHFFRVLFL